MKKLKLIIIFSCCFILNTAIAQSKQKAATAFLNELNYILKNSKEQHWKYTGTMTIDSAFAISKAGILSVTVRYTNEDGSYVRSRMEAPVNKIKKVAYDLYLILEYKEDEVTAYESEANSNELKELEKTNYFHIGVPDSDGYTRQEKLQRLLNKYQSFN